MDLERVAIIGDIHGSARQLRLLLAQIDRPVLVTGDLCDRGPDTASVLDQLIERDASGVLGNHDLWFARWSSGHGFDPFALSDKMGGAATLNAYGASPADWDVVPRAHSRFVNALHLVVDLHVAGSPYWLMHAGIPSTVPLTGLQAHQVVPHLAHTRPLELLWPKQDPALLLPVDRPIIMGHVRLPDVLDTGEVLAIDTGAPHHKLSALLLPERTSISVL
jgi:hypothetical protein